MKLAICLTAGIGFANMISAQTPPAETKFDVVSVKPSDPDSHGIGLTGDAGRLAIRNTTIRFLVRLAWNLKDYQSSGGPPLLDFARYDIDAVTTSDATFGGHLNFLTIQSNPQMRLRLQALLEDRFHLVVRHETKRLPAYYLTAAKNGPKLKESSVPQESQDMTLDRGHIKSNRMSITQLAQALSDLLGQPVVDRTELSANYDILLNWAPEGADTTNAPTIFTALQEALGLKLEAGNTPIDVLVIDRVEPPTAN